MTSRPASYRSQPACANCRHGYDREEEDMPVEYYCRFGTSDEFPQTNDGDFDPAEYSRYLAKVKAWAPRMVYAEGICDEHQSYSGTPPPRIQAPPSSPEPNEPK